MKFKLSLIAVLVLGVMISTVAFAAGREVTLVNKTGRDSKAQKKTCFK